jgi:superfamily II DNA or RNA helicase
MLATILSDTHYLVTPSSVVERMAIEAALYIQHPQLRMLQKRNPRLANWDGLVKFCKPYGSGFAVANGLLSRLRTFAEGNNMMFECDQRPMAEPVPFQQLLIEAELDVQQVAAAKAIMERRIACLEFKTGSGKSEIFLNAILCLQAAGQSTCALIIVPRKNLMYQTAERAELRTGQRIGLIGDGHCDVQPINVAVADSASGSERLANSEEIRATLRRVDCLILDESHHSASERWTGIIAACTAKQRLWAVSGKVTFFSKDHILDQMRLEEVFGPPVLTGRSDLRTCPVHVICHHYHQWDGEYDQYELAGSVTDMLPVLYKENGEWVHGVYRGLDDDGKAPDFMLKWNKNTERWVVDRDMYGVYADADSTDRIELDSANIVYYTRHDMAIVANTRRNRWAVRVATAAARKHQPFIITVKRRKHLERMLRLCREAKLNVGGVEQLDDFKAGKLAGLVATASTVSEGTDIPQLIHLIKADGDSGEQVLEQQAGRVMRVFNGKPYGVIHVPRDSQHAALNRVTGSTLNYWRRSGHKIHTQHYDDESAPIMLIPKT